MGIMATSAQIFHFCRGFIKFLWYEGSGNQKVLFERCLILCKVHRNGCKFRFSMEPLNESGICRTEAARPVKCFSM